MAVGNLALPTFNRRTGVNNVGNLCRLSWKMCNALASEHPEIQSRFNLGWLPQVNAFTMQKNPVRYNLGWVISLTWSLYVFFFNFSSRPNPSFPNLWFLLRKSELKYLSSTEFENDKFHLRTSSGNFCWPHIYIPESPIPRFFLY
jgi:hypothetical protein